MSSPLTEHHGLLLSRAAVHTADGHDLGQVVDLYFDDVTGQPTWATVSATASIHPSDASGRLAPVPLRGATYSRGVLGVVVTADQVATVPALPLADHLDGRDEQALHAHYGLTTPVEVAAPLQTSTAPGVAAGSDGTTDQQLAPA